MGSYERNTAGEQSTATLGEEGTISRAPQWLQRGPSCLYCFSAFLPQNVTFLQQAGCRIPVHRMGPKSGLYFWSQNTKAPVLQQEPIAWSSPPVSPGGLPRGDILSLEEMKRLSRAGAPSTPLISTSPCCTTGQEAFPPQCSYLCSILAKIKV